MIFEQIKELCRKNNTTVTALCLEITGSSGNITTWKKDNIKPIWLISICKKFGVSSDYLLGLTSENISIVNYSPVELSDDENVILNTFRKLNQDYKVIALGEIKKYEKLQTYEKNIEKKDTKMDA